MYLDTDKDLAQCVLEDRVVQIDRRAKIIRGAEDVRKKYGVLPALIPDYLALVGDSADGYPGIAGIGAMGAARLLNEYGPIESFPEHLLKDKRTAALLFKKLATLKTNAKLFSNVRELQWKGPTKTFRQFTKKISEPRLLERAEALVAKIQQEG